MQPRPTGLDTCMISECGTHLGRGSDELEEIWDKTRQYGLLHS